MKRPRKIYWAFRQCKKIWMLRVTLPILPSVRVSRVRKFYRTPTAAQSMCTLYKDTTVFGVVRVDSYTRYILQYMGRHWMLSITEENSAASHVQGRWVQEDIWFGSDGLCMDVQSVWI
ncbi:hypothetical protein KCU93_g488, partial [Aureobasidium melanogenum]